MPAMIRTSAGRCGTRRARARTPLRHPRQLLRRRLSDRDRLLQKHGAFDPKTDGHCPQRRPHGAGRRGIRLAQQDLPGPGDGVIRVVDDTGKVLLESTPSRPATSGALPDGRRSRAGLGEARRQPRAPQHARHLLARRKRPHDAQIIAKVKKYLPTTTPPVRHAHRPWPPRAKPRSSGSRPGRTPSASPATCSATTSPTSSRSSRSAPAP